MNNLTTYLNDLYYQFVLIEEKAYSEKVNYVENHLEYIEQLEVKVRIEILFNYARALYELRQYDKVIEILNGLIEEVILENIFKINHYDIYQELLYLKSITHLSKEEWRDSHYVLSELIKINPKETRFSQSYFDSCKIEYRSETQTFRAVCMFLLICSAAVIGLELLVVRPFYEAYTQGVEWIRNLLFFGGVLLLISYHSFFRIRFKRCVQRFVKT